MKMASRTKTKRPNKDMIPKVDADQLFARAMKHYEQGEFVKAAALFHKIALAGGYHAEQARYYLKLINARQANAKHSVRKPKAAKRARITRGAVKPKKGAGRVRLRRTARKGASQKRGKKIVARKKTQAPSPQENQREPVQKTAPPPSWANWLPSLGGSLNKRISNIFINRGRLSLPRDTSATIPLDHPPGAGPKTVNRTPHIDIRPPAPLVPGTNFNVEVFVDEQGPRSGEESTEIEVTAGMVVQVHLITSEHFLIIGAAIQSMTIDATPRSDAPPFQLKVKSAGELPPVESPHVSALFMHNGRPCGMVRRAVEISGLAAQPLGPVPARFEMTPANDADLHVTIVANATPDGREFTCFVQTPHLAAYHEPITETWILPDVTEKLVRAYMNEFTAKNASSEARIASLRGAGIRLFDATPKIFQKIFWEMIDARVPLKHIAIVSEEPFIPWELMIPNRASSSGGRERRKPLGLDFRIGRWTTPEMVKPPQKLTLLNSYIIAPDYADKKLEHSKAEADFVSKAFDGLLVTPTRFADIERSLKGGGRTLVHFICHGLDSQAGTQIIELENNEQLTSTSIEGMEGLEEAFRTSKPIVFLNACEIGRLAPALVGLGGFAASFIRLGASAVIAPLWSVKDSIAHEIAMEFYGRLKKEPETPFAEIFRKIREKAYDAANGEDTYAAYCFYGDPAAFATRI